MRENRTNRRTFLRLGGALSVGAITGLAGCPSGPSDGGDGGDGDAFVPNEPNYQGWFENVSTYEGTVDARGQSEYTVEVGVRGASGFYYFGPPAVAVSPETTVTWEWTGRGGTHNVVSTSGAFTSGQVVDEAGHTFTHTFPNPGVYRYICTPHQSMGMKGAVFVALGQRGEQA